MIGTILKSAAVAAVSAGGALVGAVGGVRLMDSWGWFDPSEEEKAADELFVVSLFGKPAKSKKKAKR